MVHYTLVNRALIDIKSAANYIALLLTSLVFRYFRRNGIEPFVAEVRC